MAKLRRGTCPVCLADVALRKDGEIREHQDHRHPDYGPGSDREAPKCPGSGQKIIDA